MKIKYSFLILYLCIVNILNSAYKIEKQRVFFNETPVFRYDKYNFQIPVDTDSFTIMDNYYAKDKYAVYFLGEQIREDIDLSSFVVVGRGISKDKDNIYKYWTRVENIDISSVKVYNDRKTDIFNSYLQDRNGIYFVKPFIGGIRVRKLKDVDIPTFEEIHSGYSKDKKSVYYRGIKIENIDTRTFQIIGDENDKINEYSKDRNSIYYKEIKIKNVDMNTFKILNPSSYSGDKNKIYYEGVEIKNVDLKTFEILPLSQYSRDKDNIYCNGKILERADRKSFRIIENNGRKIAKDENNRYYQCEIEKMEDNDDYKCEKNGYQIKNGRVNYNCRKTDIDVKSFKKIGNEYVVDNDYVYYRGIKLHGADSKTFEIINSELAKDKNHIYHRDKVLELISPVQFEILNDLSSKYNTFYAKDYKGLYYIILSNFYIPNGVVKKITGIENVKEFKILDENYSIYGDKIFFLGEEIRGVDKKTFEIIDYNYSKDKNSVYCGSTKMKNADPKTFEVVDKSRNLTKDKNNRYQNCFLID